MKEIRTFFSIAILFIFVYLISIALFSVNVFLDVSFYNGFSEETAKLFFQVLIYSFPIALVVSSFISVSYLVKKGSFSFIFGFLTFFVIALLGFQGIHFFVSSLASRNIKEISMPYTIPSYLYSEGRNFFLFQSSSSPFLQENILIQIDKSLGAAGYYPEAYWSSQEETLTFLPYTGNTSVEFFLDEPLLSYNSLNRGDAILRSFLLDVFYCSLSFISMPFISFLVNLFSFVLFILAFSLFTSFFSRLIAVFILIWMVRFFFLSYRFFSFDLVYIIGDFSFIPHSFLTYIPAFFTILSGVTLLGLYRIILLKK